ncbi:metal ABC transporter substrate-binding protein [Psychromonas aquatilis]|uniref:Metal ABC transporter substrate-binding protein n=1 Tax=Psychromonas aquatilis TaxID=2005072 RepID=A0ABU9GNV4_9GAMM
MNIKNSLFYIAMVAIPLISSPAQARLKVVTTFTIIQDIAQNVAGEHADIISITKPGAEIHNYQPTPKDIVKAQDADLILWNGLNLESWFTRFFANLEDVPSVVVSEGIKPISIYEGAYSGKPNPHAWMSLSNAKIYIDTIRDALIKYDPVNQAAYIENATAYKYKINALDSRVREKIDAVPEEKRWLVSSEGAFSYLAHDYGLKEAFLWPINAERQGTPQQVKKLIDKVVSHNISVIFSESTISDKPAKQVANETGIHYGGVLYVDSLSKSDGPVPTYLDLITVTTNTIVEGLTR